MRNKAYRIHKTESKANRRMQEDRNQHYDDQQCPCAGVGSKQAVGKVKSMFANTPKRCSHIGCCANRRRSDGPSISERKQLLRELDYKL